MSVYKILFSFGFLAVLVFPTLAKADAFVWKNYAHDVSLSFPDEWGVVSNLASDEILRIAAPQGVNEFDKPQCRLRVRDDNRFKMYPVAYSGNIQRTEFSTDFWVDYASEFAGANINHVQDNAGLGRGFASFADIVYETQENPKMVRRGIAFASLYQNKVRIFECSAEQSAYIKWYPSFMSILKSIDFKGMQPFKRGFYRDFYAGKTVIHGRRDVDDYTF